MFHKYIHVERLDTPECKGLLDDTVILSYKIDGTNACVWYDGQYHAGSRTRELTVENDNAGFCAWAMSDDPQAQFLYHWCIQHPLKIVYGEWLGTTKFVGHIKQYDKNALNHLWIFDVYDIITQEYLPHAEWINEFNGYSIPMYIMENPTVDKIKEFAETNHFLLPSDVVGEGVVVRREGFINCFGRYCIGKYVRDEYKADKSKKKVLGPCETEKQIVEEYLTAAELNKAKAKTCEYFGTEEFKIENKYIGFFMNLVYNDAILTECSNWVKKYKVKTLDFECLKHLTFSEAKKYLGL